MSVLAILFALAGYSYSADVCRTSSFQGMTDEVDRIKKVLGPDTTDMSKIKLYITQNEDMLYIQSNFRSKDPSSFGSRFEFPTKLRTNEIKNLKQAMLNVIYADRESMPVNVDVEIEKALSTTAVMVDKATIDQNGRPLLDLEGTRDFTLVTRTSSIGTGKLELLPLKNPPPSIIETIAGCCLKGRPPGRAKEILAKLSSIKMSAENTVFLSMVVDTATNKVIETSPDLRAAKQRASFSEKASWDQNIDSALKAAQNKPLLILGHIENDNVVVLDRTGKAVFSIGLTTLRDRAKAQGAELFVLGCDTVQFIEDNSMSLGVVGIHNSKTLAEKVAKALPNSRSLAELAENLSGPDLTLVAYDKLGGNGYTGASAFAKVQDDKFFTRVFRLLALRD